VNASYPTVAQRADHRCEYCHAPEAIFNFPFEVKHIIPVSAGGTDDETNLALSCRSCNLRKGGRLGSIDEDTGNVERLFHPREDVWEAHFRVSVRSGEVLGRTPSGRATVLCLQMNSPDQLAARTLWTRLGLFP
jgi:hypothetical protein